MEDTVLAECFILFGDSSANTALRDGGDYTFQVSINMIANNRYWGTESYL